MKVRERQILHDIIYILNLKKYIYVTKQKQTHRPREQTRGSQWGGGTGVGRVRGMGLRDTNSVYKVDKHQGHTVQYRELKPLS